MRNWQPVIAKKRHEKRNRRKMEASPGTIREIIKQGFFLLVVRIRIPFRFQPGNDIISAVFLKN